ncbi:MAG: hypothetical protein J0I06_19295 [Planctomycetes bacterium]|nr:hypothetical protein [Planctomycetota bacterium]
MASEHTDPDGPAPDAFEAELVAYLDGELDPAAARRVEARLAKDPAARARAAELKRSFDLLDYLPRPEPSPTFTTRTLDKLPAVKPSAARPTGSGPANPLTAAGRACSGPRGSVASSRSPRSVTSRPRRPAPTCSRATGGRKRRRPRPPPALSNTCRCTRPPTTSRSSPNWPGPNCSATTRRSFTTRR